MTVTLHCLAERDSGNDFNKPLEHTGLHRKLILTRNSELTALHSTACLHQLHTGQHSSCRIIRVHQRWQSKDQQEQPGLSTTRCRQDLVPGNHLVVTWKSPTKTLGTLGTSNCNHFREARSGFHSTIDLSPTHALVVDQELVQSSLMRVTNFLHLRWRNPWPKYLHTSC